MKHPYDEFKTKLIEMRAELSQRENQIEDDRRRHQQPLNADSGERVVETENDEVLDALDAATLQQLQAIDDALARIDSGNYGICSDCGQTIAIQRLAAIPHTKLCIDCATRMEA